MTKRFTHRLWISLLTIAVLMVTAFLVGRASAPRPEPEPAPTAAEPVAAEHADGNDEGETIYICPMHPDQTSTDPNATCPICGMDLVPRRGDGADDDRDLPVLRLSERAMRLMDIQTQPAERRAAATEVRFVGRLDFNEQRLVDVVARSDSYIEALHANYRWMPVQRGQKLAEFYSPAATAAAEELLVIQRHRGERNPTALDAGRAKLRRLGVSPDQIDRILETGQVPETFELRSPIDGVVADLPAREGDWLSDGARLMRITDLSTLWLHLEAFESDLQWLSPGQQTQFTVQSLPGHAFDGEVTFIDPIVDDRRRTARVRLEVPNPEGILKPGMFARGRIEAAVSGDGRPLRVHEEEGYEADEPLLIPATAPLITGRRAIVYIRLPDTERPTFEGRQVVLGPRVGDHYVILEGLEEGDRVVTRGAVKIDSELQIDGRPSMMGRGELFGEQPPAEPRIDPEHPALEIDPADVPEVFAERAADALGSYFDLIQALLDSDLDAARQAVVAYYDVLGELDDDELEQPLKEAWHALTPNLHQPLHRMNEAGSLDEVRRDLERLSDHTALMVKAFIGDRAGEVYRIHCSMALDGEGGDWLQPDPEVRNPYFDVGHSRCGVVQDELLPPIEVARPPRQDRAPAPAAPGHQH